MIQLYIHTPQYTTLYTHAHIGLYMAYACGLTNQNHQLTRRRLYQEYTHQARWLGQLTWETRHFFMWHALMLIISPTRSGVRHQGDKSSLTYTTWLFLRWLTLWCSFSSCKERNNHNDTTCVITSQWRKGHALTTTRTCTLHITYQNFPIKQT